MTVHSSKRDGYQVEVRNDPIEVTCSMPWAGPDPAWEHTDSHAHTHRWATEVRHGEIVASGEQSWHWVLDDPEGGDFWFDADGEEYNAPRHAECRQCGDTLEPGTITHPADSSRRYIPGLTSGTLTYPDGRTFDLTGDDVQRIYDHRDDIASVAESLWQDKPDQRLTWNLSR